MQDIPYFKRTTEQHVMYRTSHLYDTLEDLKYDLHVKYIMKPMTNNADCARLMPGVKYKVYMISETGEIYGVTLRNILGVDEVEVLDVSQALGHATINAPAEKHEKVPSPVEEKPEQNKEDFLIKQAKEWFKSYSEKLFGEIELIPDQPISLGKEYRIPCQEMEPYLDILLRKETNGQYGIDSIDEDLIATVIPIQETSKKVEPKSQTEKFRERQAKAQ